MTQHKVFIATSLDGYIADHQGSVDFLYRFPEPPGEDMGYPAFMESTDAILMGRKTFETVLGFDISWPYEKPVFVWSSVLKQIPPHLKGDIQLIQGTPQDISTQLQNKGFHSLYIDGGQTIQAFLQADLIDELTITTIPILLGAGLPLFNALTTPITYRGTHTKLFSNGTIQSTFIRDKAR